MDYFSIEELIEVILIKNDINWYEYISLLHHFKVNNLRIQRWIHNVALISCDQCYYYKFFIPLEKTKEVLDTKVIHLSNLKKEMNNKYSLEIKLVDTKWK